MTIQKIMSIENVLFLFSILVLLYSCVRLVQYVRTEGLENSTDTIVGMENAYTNIHCVRDDLPVIKLGRKSIACLKESPESDCLKYVDFNAPENIQCTNSRNNLNLYLSKQGLLNTSSQSRQMFDRFMKNGYYNIECNKEAFDDPNHWCHQVKTAIDQRCSNKTEFEKVTDKLCNEDLLSYAVAQNPDNTDKTIPTKFDPNSFQTRALKCKRVSCVRQRGSNKALCESNCNLCGNTVC